MGGGGKWGEAGWEDMRRKNRYKVWFLPSGKLWTCLGEIEDSNDKKSLGFKLNLCT